VSLWFRVYSDLLDDWKVQRLPGKKFRRQFLACLAGEENEFSRFVRPDNGRLPAAQWAVVRQRVYERDDFTCTYCGSRGTSLECDHIMPVSRGGSNELENLTTACRPCNRAKRNKTPEEWRQ
jgi:5-methylcytosine-specific restriction endonuclease McrA